MSTQVTDFQWSKDMDKYITKVEVAVKDQVAMLLAADTRKEVSTPHPPSGPKYGFPAKRSGDLKASIRASRSGSNTLVIATERYAYDLHEGHWHGWGGTYVAPRPYFRKMVFIRRKKKYKLKSVKV